MKLLSPKIKYLFDEFSIVEKVIFSALSFFLIFSTAMLFIGIIDLFRHDAAAYGGTLHEGVIGVPNFINPLLSNTSAGRDLAYLTYSGLMKINEHGQVVPDLAESYTLSDDGLTYTFKMRNDIFFHDGEHITTKDVAFTIEKAKDLRVKSPLASNWLGVTVKAVDEKTVTFSLKTRYSPFLENTAIGILPEHIWKDAELDQFTFSPYNFDPIGSGAYEMAEIKRKADGTPEYYKLTSFNDYGPGEKHISTIYIHIYPDTSSLLSALRKGDIESAADIKPSDAKALANEGYRIEKAKLLRVFGVFFNQNQVALFTDRDVRLALSLAVDKKQIIDKVLLSYAHVEDAPLPGGSTLEATTTDHAGAAIKLLESKGWKKNAGGIMEKKSGSGTITLSFTLSTSDNPELVAAAALLKEQWKEIGADVTITSLEPSELNQTVIRPRKYDALLFGEIIGRGNDLYPFWYSGERKDPGLNIALYTNAKADTLLQKARMATSSDEVMKNISAFEDLVRADVPAIFLYSPEFLYVVPERLKGLTLPSLELGTERWTGIFASFINVKKQW